jgi:hypothetical protein
MPIGDITGEALGGIVRAVARIVFEIVFEFLVKGTGHAVLRVLRPRAEPGEGESAVVGLVVWLVVAGVGFWVYRTTFAA